jgi:hypothetical protein
MACRGTDLLLHIPLTVGSLREPGSSVSTVSGYGLDDRAIERTGNYSRQDPHTQSVVKSIIKTSK